MSLANVYEWLCNTRWGISLPKRIDVGDLLQNMHTVGPLIHARKPPSFSPEEPPEPVLIVLAWSNALAFVIRQLQAIVAVQEEPFDARSTSYRPIHWIQPWAAKTLEFGPKKILFFQRTNNTLIRVYENFRVRRRSSRWWSHKDLPRKASA